MYELALPGSDSPVTLKTISGNQEISIKYLHSLLTMLKSAGLVRSISGSKGGYLLARKPAEITLLEIVTVLEGPISVVDCVADRDVCARVDFCAARDVWEEVNNAIEDVLVRRTLEDLVEKCGAGICNTGGTPEYSI
jgi:Rrf2 family protein